MMNFTQLSTDRRFWLKWVVASAIGLAAGFAVYLPLVLYFASELGAVLRLLLAAVAGTFFGSALGTAQWLLLRRRSLGAGKWVLATLAGGTVGGNLAMVIGDVAGNAGGFSFAIAAGGFVLGALVGTGQCLVLQSRLSRAFWWVLASALGLAASLGMANAAGDVLRSALVGVFGEALTQVLAIVIAAVLFLIPYGAITGAALLWIQRRQADIEQDRPLGVESTNT
jgi:hypothetical protein